MRQHTHMRVHSGAKGVWLALPPMGVAWRVQVGPAARHQGGRCAAVLPCEIILVPEQRQASRGQGSAEAACCTRRGCVYAAGWLLPCLAGRFCHVALVLHRTPATAGAGKKLAEAVAEALRGKASGL